MNTGEGMSTRLHGVAAFGQLEAARWLPDHGASTQAHDYEGKMPEQAAEAAGHAELAAMLRERSASA